ncbi:phospholipase DDHD2-like [Uloborus diversus]|uniref:phospholipase DDHD2-like n=1 Tax=Uloborus diversus TaxID=327109 RepID=UPI002409989E|nr:phospholipase DDHD2-like [Uloborus diversus]
MSNKDIYPKKNESSLLFQNPNALFCADMSEDNFLMPVAVNNLVDEQRTRPKSDMNQDKEENSQKAGGDSSVCQLEQPLLIRKAPVSGTSGQPAQLSQDFGSWSATYANPTSYSSIPQTSSSHLQTISQAQLPIQNSNPYSSPHVSTYCSPIYSEQPVISSDNSMFQPNERKSSAGFSEAPLSSINQPLSTYNIHAGYTGPYISSYSEVPSVPSTTFLAADSSQPVYAPPVSNQTGEQQSFNIPPCNYYGAPQANINTSRSYSSESVYSQGTSNMSDKAASFTFSDQISATYKPVKPHWLFSDIIESKEIWFGFSQSDSERLETAFQKDKEAVVPTDGGRYDAFLGSRVKKSVYFDAKDLYIRRCTWFFRSDSSQKFVPFDEDVANLIEEHFRSCMTTGHWQKRVSLPGVGTIVLESPDIMLLYKNELEIWPAMPDSKTSPKVIKRGLPDGFELMPDEPSQVDHLVFIVQGIGSFCDLRFRTVSQCVDGFRDIANKLMTSHFKQHVESGNISKVEFLPLAWHAKLHTSDLGLDRRMQKITLPSIPKLRHFTNDTLLDILLYSSPQYCQSIIDTVAHELNRLYEIFLARNPDFAGRIFVAGHSLGSLILFDILANQNHCEKEQPSVKTSNQVEEKELIENYCIKSEITLSEQHMLELFPSVEAFLENLHLQDFAEIFEREKIDLASLLLLSDEDLKNLGLPTGSRKKILNTLAQLTHAVPGVLSTSEQSLPCKANEFIEDVGEGLTTVYPSKTKQYGMSMIVYPRLSFEPACFFALGSPISMFLTIRGYDTISEDFRFPTCPGFFHIFHPYDPVATRIEPLIDPNFAAKPVLIPHHKGRKRMHLEIKENLSKVGNEIKQKFIETLRYTWNSLSGFAAHAFPSAAVEAEMEKIVKQQMSESEGDIPEMSETTGEEIQIGCLNSGRRIDFVLQEKPIEALNDYIFALTSHATYWNSEDTVLMILREIYALDGISISNENRNVSHHGLAMNDNVFPSSRSSGAFMDSVRCETQMIHSNIASVEHISQNIPAANSSHNFPLSYSDTVLSESQISRETTLQSNTIPPSQPIGPPPLSGFVKKSPFNR